MASHRPHWEESIFLAGLAGFAYLLFMGSVPLAAGTEGLWAESARELALLGQPWQLTDRFSVAPQLPPLMIWIQALFIKVLGANLFAVRFPAMLLGMATVVVLYWQGSLLRDRLLGRLWAGLYLACLGTAWLHKTALPDVGAAFFLGLAAIQIMRLELPRKKDAPPAESPGWTIGFLCGLASWSMGFWAGLSLLMAWLSWNLWRQARKGQWGHLFRAVVAWLVLFSGWHVLTYVMTYGSGWETLPAYLGKLFFPGGFTWMGPVWALLLSLFPLVAPWLGLFRITIDKEPLDLWKNFAGTWLVWGLVMSFFPLYGEAASGSLAFWPGSFLAALFFYQHIRNPQPLPRAMWIIGGVGASLWLLILGFWNVWMENMPLFLRQLQPLGAAEHWPSVRNWTGWEWSLGVIWLVGSLVAFRWWQLGRSLRYIWWQAGLTVLCANLFLLFLLSPIRDAQQGGMQAFFEKLQGEEIYLITDAASGSLPYFYAQMLPPSQIQAKDDTWLTEGQADRDVYVVISSSQWAKVKPGRFRNFERLYEAGGWIFLLRPSPYRRLSEKAAPTGFLSNPYILH
ncbi:MAG: hypothetical protein AAFR61_08435 [Bacteroidota bacterium]